MCQGNRVSPDLSEIEWYVPGQPQGIAPTLRGMADLTLVHFCSYHITWNRCSGNNMKGLPNCHENLQYAEQARRNNSAYRTWQNQDVFLWSHGVSLYPYRQSQDVHDGRLAAPRL